MRRSQERARGWIISAVATLLIGLQAFVVQTHVHALAPQAAFAELAHAENDGHSAHAKAPHAQAACELCALLALSGRALAAPTIAFEPPRGRFVAALAPDIPIAPRALTHSWRSRAPPFAL